MNKANNFDTIGNEYRQRAASRRKVSKYRFKSCKLFAFLFIFLFSCQSPIFYRITTGIPEQNIDISFTNINEAWKWIADNIEYEYTYKKQTPEEVYKNRRGDCLSKAILLQYFGYKMGLDVKLVVIQITELNALHAILKINNQYLDSIYYDCYWPDNFPFYTYHIIKELSYEEAFFDNSLKSVKQ